MDFFSLEEVLLLIILASSNGLKLNALMMDLFFFKCRFSLYITLLDGLKLLDCLWIIVIFFFIAVWILTAPIHSIDEQEILNLVILNFPHIFIFG